MATGIKQHLDLRALLIGLGAVVVLYAGLFSYVLLSSNSTLKTLEARLAGKTTMVSRDDVTTAPSPALKAGDMVDIDEAHSAADAPSSHDARDLEKHEATTHEEPAHHEQADEQQAERSVTEPAEVKTDKAPLAPAPLPGLFEPAKGGFLPKVSPQGLTPFKAYKKPAPGLSKPFIALAVRDYGLSGQDATLALKTLPAEVSLILSPYSSEAEKWKKQARQNGHELWIEVPFENSGFPGSDYGPQTLLSRQSLQYNQKRLEWALTRTTGYAGVAGYMDDIFTGARPLLQSLLQLNFGKGLGYLELNPKGPDFIETFAATNSSPYIRTSHIFADTNAEKLQAYFSSLEQRAKSGGGIAVGVLPAYPRAVEDAATWLNTLKAKGISIAPVSAVMAGF